MFIFLVREELPIVLRVVSTMGKVHVYTSVIGKPKVIMMPEQ